jgi:hypothetical protein
VNARTETSLRCPVCGKQARATVEWSERQGAPHAEVCDYHCPSGCAVDAATVREIIGAP